MLLGHFFSRGDRQGAAEAEMSVLAVRFDCMSTSCKTWERIKAQFLVGGLDTSPSAGGKGKNQTLVHAHNQREPGFTFGIQGSGSRILQGFLFIV